MSSDSDLLAAYAQRGCQDALGQIIHRHAGRVHAVCLSVLGNGADAEDAAQATFLVLVKKAGSLPPSTVLSGWLYLTAITTARTLRRSAQRRRQHEREAGAMQSPVHNTELPNDLIPQMRQALAELPAAQRDALVLRYIYGQSEEEAAREMNCPVGTLHSRVAGGMEKLRGRMSKREAVLGATALAALLSAPVAEAAPAGLSASIQAVCTGKAVASAAATGAANGVLQALFWAKLQFAALAAAVVMALGVPVAVVWPSFFPSATPALAQPSVTQIDKIVTPQPAPPEIAENDDGQRLNDEKVWHWFGKIPASVQGSSFSVPLENGEDVWKFAGMVNRRVWNLDKGPVVIKATVEGMDVESVSFQPNYWRVEGDAREAWDVFAKYSPSIEHNPDVRVLTDMSGAQHKVEWVVTKNNVTIVVDGVAEKNPHQIARPLERAFVGIVIACKNRKEPSELKVLKMSIQQMEQVKKPNDF